MVVIGGGIYHCGYVWELLPDERRAKNAEVGTSSRFQADGQPNGISETFCGLTTTINLPKSDDLLVCSGPLSGIARPHGHVRRARDRPPGNRPQGKIADGHFATRQHRVTNRLSSILRGTFRVPGVHPGTGHYRICSNRRLAMPETMSLVALGSTNGHLYKGAS